MCLHMCGNLQNCKVARRLGYYYGGYYGGNSYGGNSYGGDSTGGDSTGGDSFVDEAVEENDLVDCANIPDFSENQAVTLFDNNCYPAEINKATLNGLSNSCYLFLITGTNTKKKFYAQIN